MACQELQPDLNHLPLSCWRDGKCRTDLQWIYGTFRYPAQNCRPPRQVLQVSYGCASYARGADSDASAIQQVSQLRPCSTGDGPICLLCELQHQDEARTQSGEGYVPGYSERMKKRQTLSDKLRLAFHFIASLIQIRAYSRIYVNSHKNESDTAADNRPLHGHHICQRAKDCHTNGKET